MNFKFPEGGASHSVRNPDSMQRFVGRRKKERNGGVRGKEGKGGGLCSK